eukprot:g41921.t1
MIRMTVDKPTVVLAGWLGCKRRSLRRYETLYKDMGWNVIVQIASPIMVVKAAIELVDDVVSPPPPSQRPPASGTTPTCMHDLALDTLDQVQKSRCTGFVFHAFSNGGALLWEEVRDIITKSRSRHSSDNNRSGEYDSMRNKLLGLVFDSAPAYYDGRNLMEALSHATLEEQEEGKAFVEKAKYEVGGDDAFAEIRLLRAQQYWQGMRNDDTKVPHLYLYSKADPLTSFRKLDELIEYRRSRFGNESISALCFVDSPHCCHFLKYPENYLIALRKFLTTKCMVDFVIAAATPSTVTNINTWIILAVMDKGPPLTSSRKRLLLRIQHGSNLHPLRSDRVATL